LLKKEHSGTLNNPRLFPETWWEVEYFEIKDGSRKYWRWEIVYFANNFARTV
jgi:hypothetical protein